MLNKIYLCIEISNATCKSFSYFSIEASLAILLLVRFNWFIVIYVVFKLNKIAVQHFSLLSAFL